MFSLGIENERAFSTAFWSARLPAGSGPPSRAATMIARASFENIWPRFASVAFFLCLICAHLLCPATAALPDHGPDPVHARRPDRGDPEGCGSVTALNPFAHALNSRFQSATPWVDLLVRLTGERGQRCVGC